MNWLKSKWNKIRRKEQKRKKRPKKIISKLKIDLLKHYKNFNFKKIKEPSKRNKPNIEEK